MRHISKIILAAILLFSVPSTGAVTIASTAGNLSELISDKTITELTITGQVDARDLVFVADELSSLTSLDLSGANIMALESDEPVVGNAMHFGADELPATIFFGKNYASIVLPTSLKSIGAQALAGCSGLTAIEIPASVTSIGDDAFNACGLTSVTIPATVQNMGARAVANCPQLLSANIQCANLGEEAFAGCVALTTVNIGSGVNTIGAAAFKGTTALQTLNVAEGASLQAIGERAFMSSGIQAVDFTDIAGLETIGMWAFANTALTELKLGNSLSSVGDGAFFYNTALETVEMPQGITRVGDYLFAGCNTVNNDSVIIEGYTEVGKYAFLNWDQMTRFVVPSTVTYIGDRAMAGMTGLEMMSSYATSVPELGQDVWEGVNQPAVTLFVSESSVDDYRDAAQWQEFKIDMEPTDTDEPLIGDADIKAYFSGPMLIVKAQHEINSVNIYEVNGVLLSQVNPGTTEAAINTANFSGKLYVVAVETADGTKKAFKLIRE